MGDFLKEIPQIPLELCCETEDKHEKIIRCAVALPAGVRPAPARALGYAVFGSPREPGTAMPYWVAEGIRTSQWREKEHRQSLTVILRPQTGQARILEDEKAPALTKIPSFSP